jgi:hypothetical protein
LQDDSAANLRAILEIRAWFLRGDLILRRIRLGRPWRLGGSVDRVRFLRAGGFAEIEAIVVVAGTEGFESGGTNCMSGRGTRPSGFRVLG